MSEPARRGVAHAVVVAAGASSRFGGEVPKVLVAWRGRPLLAHALGLFDACDDVVDVVLVASEAVEAGWREAGSPGRKVAAVVRGGASRQESVAAGIGALGSRGALGASDVVLVHDAARPFATPALVARVVAAAREHGAAVPILRVVDTVKRLAPPGRRGEGGGGEGTRSVEATLDRDRLGLAQTPQGVRADVLDVARRHARESDVVATDDVALVEAALAAGVLSPPVGVAAVEGEEANVKVTRRGDLASPVATSVRVGLGHDIHPLEAGRPFILAGIDVQPDAPGDERVGPVGHSDGDALSHAICDALLSAAAMPDIGRIFPDDDPANAGRPSLEFVRGVGRRLAAEGWRVGNVAAVLRLERPKLSPHVDAIRAALAAELGVEVERIAVSAKRGEGLGDVGAGCAVVCDVVAAIERAE